MAFGKKKKVKKVKRPPAITGPVRQAQPVRHVQTLRRVHPGQPVAPRATAAPAGTPEVTSDPYLARLTPEERAKREARERMLKEVLKFVEEHPEEAGRLLRVWQMGEE